MTGKQRLHRAEFLTNWFLEVFKGRKAPFPRRCFKGIAQHMEDFLASGGRYKSKYKKKRKVGGPVAGFFASAIRKSE